MSGHIIVLTTVSSEDEGMRIARELVTRRLAACVNVTSPVRSVYRWKGAVREETERLLLIKTVAEDFDRLKTTLLKLHSYELPEVVAIPIQAGLDSYLNWITAAASDEPTEIT
jgi:periplasmic divalent cation tolerance protein